MQMSLYVHFPFCRSKCNYCDFCSFTADNGAIESYCDSLMREMELASEAYPDTEIETVYFGGGTPSVVPAALMRRVTWKLRECFAISQDIEFTSEANPGTVTDEWLTVMVDGGMNRLSLGIQAKQGRLLHLLGRIHSFPQVQDTLDSARKHGVANLSVDLMYGLPTQTVGEYLDSIKAAADLRVQHISAYSLTVEPGTQLQTMIETGEAALPDEDKTADMMDRGIALFRSLGFGRYEISNYAKSGYESKHNLRYWRQQYYLGLGLNAASMLPAEHAVYLRRTNTASLERYQELLSAGKLPVEETIPAYREDAMFETVMLGLRTAEGVSYQEFEAMHGIKLDVRYGKPIATLQAKGWLLRTNPAEPRLALNDKGLALQNTVMMYFMNIE